MLEQFHENWERKDKEKEVGAVGEGTGGGNAGTM